MVPNWSNMVPKPCLWFVLGPACRPSLLFLVCVYIYIYIYTYAHTCLFCLMCLLLYILTCSPCVHIYNICTYICLSCLCLGPVSYNIDTPHPMINSCSDLLALALARALAIGLLGTLILVGVAYISIFLFFCFLLWGGSNAECKFFFRRTPAKKKKRRVQVCICPNGIGATITCSKKTLPDPRRCPRAHPPACGRREPCVILYLLLKYKVAIQLTM